tara:strand:+ start:164 stop:907 length:744 start_codon:yes stop_codon:yes gene_type:complete
MNFIPKVTVVEKVNEDTGEVNQNFIYSDEDDVVDEVDEVDVDDVDDLVVEPLEDPDDIFVEADAKPKPKKEPKINKNGKVRQPMSEEHKMKLKAARDKAVLAKRAKAQERKVLKEEQIQQKQKQKLIDDEEKALAEEEKQLKKLKRAKDLQQLKEELNAEPVAQQPVAGHFVAPQIIKEIIKEPSFTLADIERAQLNAIMASEKLRLQRKDDKRKKQAEEAEFDRLKQRLMKAQNPRNNFNSSRGFF